MEEELAKVLMEKKDLKALLKNQPGTNIQHDLRPAEEHKEKKMNEMQKMIL